MFAGRAIRIKIVDSGIRPRFVDRIVTEMGAKAMITRRQFMKVGAAAGAAAVVPWNLGVRRAFAAQSPQVPLAASVIKQFVDPLPNLLDADHLIVDDGTQIELEMREHKAMVLPAGAVPGYTGTYVWSYLKPGQETRTSRTSARWLSPRAVSRPR